MFFLLNLLALVLLFTPTFGIDPVYVKFFCSKGGAQGIQLTIVDLNSPGGSVDWDTARKNGCSFAYFEAAPPDRNHPEHLAKEAEAAKKAGFLYGVWDRGADFTKTSGADFANNLASNGTTIGATLPGVITIDDSGTGVSYCGGLGVTPLVKWLRDFSETYKDKTGRYPVIATQPQWWNACTGKNTDFGQTNPWWNLRDVWTHRGKTISPAGWANATFISAPLQLSVAFNGSDTALQTFADQSSSG